MMALIRSVLNVLFAALAAAACGSPPAQAQTWEVIDQPGGYKVARVSMTGGGSGLVQGIGLTCERAVPMIVLNLAQAPARNPAMLSLSDGKATGKLGVFRNGATNVWAGPVRDTRVLDMLARVANVEVMVDDVRYGSVTLTGAAVAMRAALGGCWAGGDVGSPSAGRSSTGTTSFTGKPMAVADSSSPETIQTSFPTRDPTTGSLRLPVKLGTYIEAGKSCAQIAEAERIFLDVGGGAGTEGAGHGGPTAEIRTLRQIKPGTYVTHELISVQDTAEGNYTYGIADPEHFIVSGGGRGAMRYEYCPQASLPISERYFLASEQRRLPLLPIVAGYYEIWASYDTQSTPTCEEFCGYMLITERGIAQATTSVYAEPMGKIERLVLVSPTITQDAPLHYFAKGKDDWPYFGFTMDGAGGFTIDPEGEGGTVHVRRVDPATIPAVMMPRF